MNAIAALEHAQGTGRLARPLSWRKYKVGIGWNVDAADWWILPDDAPRAPEEPSTGGVIATIPEINELREEWETVPRLRQVHA